ncbi:hypothetical protein QFC22_001345 [Naganishia vaughanmartiniae]|uniref:Uncharacterized protein n=1 Tax=Naganishia vaughanmartiniae TaxID=1424756 RepID=A0ACC2XKA3_9TREE|nr:hypothetical protein QFC22_001345 [Naganishia vaughanmartiniae]
MTKATTLSFLLLSWLAISAEGAATYNAQPGRHAPPYLASKLGNHKRSAQAWLDRVMSGLPASKHSTVAASKTPAAAVPSSGGAYYGKSHGLTPPRSLQLTAPAHSSAGQKRDIANNLSSDWSYVGCVEESDSTRLLNGFGFSSTGQNSISVCTAICGQMGYEYAGAEYGQECYCGNAYNGDGGQVFADSDCEIPCPGDNKQACGNAWRIALYKRDASAASSSHAASATASGSGSAVSNTRSLPSNTNAASTSAKTTAASQTASHTTTKTTSAPGPIHTDTTDSSEWYSLGCAVDEGGRVLGDYYVAQGDMTIDLCLDICEGKGYKYAGLEYGEECMCGNTLKTGVTYDNNDWSCNMPCAGDASELCGSGWRLDVYEFASSGDVEYCDETSTSARATSASRSTTVINNNFVSTRNPSSAAAVTSAKATSAPAASSVKASSVVASTSKAIVASSVRSATPAASTATGAVVAGATKIPSSSAAHEVYAHHMVGNTYPYSQNDWATDVKLAKAASIDGFALNMGSDWWQPARVTDAYAAAEAAGGFTMFLSLDMTSLSCSSYTDGIVLANLVKAHASSSAQAMWNGKVLVSTFSGENCYFGQGSVNDGWNNAFIAILEAAGIDIFFVPSVFSDPSTFSSATWMDGELNWNGGWPMDGNDLTTSSDTKYINALGSKEYMAAISPAFFTHFPVNGWNKNWIYRGDDWLYSKRWEDVIGMRDQVKMVEILTWNDYGEASYIGPVAGALPSGSERWTDGFPHTAWLEMTKYYAQAFKTGSWPTIASDSVFVWARPHPKAATASNDATGRPTGWDRTDDNLYAVVFATDSATVTLTAGKNTQSYPVNKGVNKLKLSSSAGSITAKMVRNGQTVASYDAGGDYSYDESPSTYNFNYFVGSSS